MKRTVCTRIIVLLMVFILSTGMTFAETTGTDLCSLENERSLIQVSVGFVRNAELQGRSSIVAISDTTPELMWVEIMLQKLIGTDPTNESHWTNQWTTPEYRYDNSEVGTMMITDYFDVIIGGTYRTKVTFYEKNGGITTSIGPVYSQSAAL